MIDTGNEQAQVVRHYYNPEDERAIKGASDSDQIYATGQNAGISHQTEEVDIMKCSPEDVNIENGREPSSIISKVYGQIVAIGLISTNWKHKESALQYILRKLKVFLKESERGDL